MRVLFQSVCTTAVLVVATAAVGQDRMPWQPNLETAQRVAAETNRLVLVHFWAPWCRPCMQLESNVFSNRETARALEANFVMVKLNADDEAAARRRFGVSSLPTDVIITPSGALVAQLQSPPTVPLYVKKMNQAAAGHRALARKPQPPATAPQQPATPSADSGAMHDPYAAPPGGATAPPVDRYAEYFPDSTHAANVPAEAHPVRPAQAYSAAPDAAPAAGGVIDPYAAAPTTPPADSRYAQGPAGAAPPATGAAPPATAQAPVVDPYAEPPAAAQPPIGAQPPANPYANPAAQQPPANPYANPAAQQPPANPYANPVAQQPPANPYANPVAQQPPAGPPATQPPANPYAAPPQQQPPAYAAAPAAPQANVPQLPPGCPPVGLDGNCPVTLLERKRWSVGNTAYGAVHRGRTYLFLGPQEKEKFLADPDRYSPVLSGMDPIHALEGQKAVPGRREFGVFGADGKVYLFADEATRSRFEQNEQYYTSRVQQQSVAGVPGAPPAYQAMRPPAR